MSNWIEWNGGECPVVRGTFVDVKYRNGEIRENLPALEIIAGDDDASRSYWKNDNCDRDIVAYRLSEVDVTPITTPTEALITERGNRYGEFKDGAAIMQQLKDVMHTAPKWNALKPSQKEALEMIQHKIGRILNGDPDYDDNWKDIAGYATLVVKEIEG